MRGLIYKEFSVFYKCIDKKLVVIALGFTALLIYTAGSYGGLMASILFSMTIGMQNIMSFTSDEKANWKKYQMAMPLSDFAVVASKYISVICTLGFSLFGSLVFVALSGILSGAVGAEVWKLAVSSAVLIPLIWTGICLPLTYWFGVQSAQAMGMFIVIPVFYLVKYFEDGSGLSAMAIFLSSRLGAAVAGTVVFFALSMAVSAAGYGRKR